MSTIDATVSMLEVMPEEARLKVFEFTQQMFVSKKQENPFVSVTVKSVLSDLAESRQQIAEGNGLDMGNALEELGKQHGFV